MNTSARMLRLLSLLQTHRYWPGGELSDRLEVSPRTLRRDVDRLRELGYTVDAVRGVAGGYQLRAGGSLPPLLLEDEEAVAVAVGLQSVGRRAAPPGMEETVGAGAVQGDRADAAAAAPPDGRAALADRAARRGPAARPSTRRCSPPWPRPAATPSRSTSPTPPARPAAEPTDRWVEPHRMVSLGRRWYLVAYDRDRQDWRSFRRRPDHRRRAPRGQRFRPRELPADDALSFVQAGIRRMPQRYAVRVRLDADAGRGRGARAAAGAEVVTETATGASWR